MLVKAKYNFGYRGRAILGHEIFEMDDKDLAKYAKDIKIANYEDVVVKREQHKSKIARKPQNKMVKKSNVKNK